MRCSKCMRLTESGWLRKRSFETHTSTSAETARRRDRCAGEEADEINYIDTVGGVVHRDLGVDGARIIFP